MPSERATVGGVPEEALIYGNPCMSSDWVTTVQECKNAAVGGYGYFLAMDVLATFGLPISMSSVPSYNEYTSLCPLDIFNQDPLGVIRASLDALLSDRQYWEVYADENGLAKFVKILDRGAANTKSSPMPEIRYCMPSVKMDDLVDLVIIRGATAVPEFICGDQYIEIFNTAQPVSQDICGNINIFTLNAFDANESAITALGKKMEWGALAESKWAPGVSDACDIGTFRQYGTAVYPEFDRKQVYKDNISDPIEIGPFQTIVAWVMDVEFVGFSDEDLRHYSVTFTQGGTEIPVRLKDSNPLVGLVYGSSLENYFPIECDISTGQAMSEGCMTPEQVLEEWDKAQKKAEIERDVCKVPSDAKEYENIYYTGGYIVPNMYSYGIIHSCLNFNDASRWSYLGYDKCGGDPVDNIYDQTTSILAMGCPLRDWKVVTSIYGTSYFYGIQTEHMVMNLTEGEHWVEVDPNDFSGSEGIMQYALRFQAPPKATSKSYGWGSYVGWQNPFYNQLGQYLESAAPGWWGSLVYFLTAQPCWEYRPPGYLVGMNGGLFTLDVNSLYAKVTVSRPGIQFYGAGKNIRPLLQSLSFRAWPIYQYNMQQPIAACGDNYSKVIDPSTGEYDAIYCTQEDLSESDMEELRSKMTGIVLDYTISALFPTDSTDEAYFSLGELCKEIACDLYNYYNSFSDEPYKGYTYICGPPTSEEEVPQLGLAVYTPHGQRTVNAINYSYQDESSFTVNVEVGPAMVSAGGLGQLYQKQTENVTVNGKVVQVLEGALFKVDVPGIGLVSAWNAAKWPWDIGDTVQVELFNVPKEV